MGFLIYAAYWYFIVRTFSGIATALGDMAQNYKPLTFKPSPTTLPAAISRPVGPVRARYLQVIVRRPAAGQPMPLPIQVSVDWMTVQSADGVVLQPVNGTPNDLFNTWKNALMQTDFNRTESLTAGPEAVVGFDYGEEKSMTMLTVRISNNQIANAGEYDFRLLDNNENIVWRYVPAVPGESDANRGLYQVTI